VNVIRLRNMPDSRKIVAEKWRRTVTIVDWLYRRSRSRASIKWLPSYEGLAAGEGHRREVARHQGRQDAQSGDDGAASGCAGDGTSLENAFAVIQTLVPKPDNVILITDGLPTQARAHRPQERSTVTGV